MVSPLFTGAPRDSRRRSVWPPSDRPQSYEVHARREGHSDQVVQHPGRLSRRRCPAGPAPGHEAADRPAGPGAALPDGADQAGGQPGALDRDPRRGPRHLPALAADARSTARAAWRRRSTRRRTSTTSTRASARPAATSRTPPSRRPTTTSRKASSGSPPRPAPASGARALALACQMFGLECKVYMVKVSYQQKPYRRIMMETWGAQVVASPSPDTAVRPEGPRAGPGLARLASASPSARPSRTPPRATTPSTRSAACSTTSSCTRRHRPGGQEAAGDGRRLPRHRHRLRRRRHQLRRARLPVRRATSSRGRNEDADHRRRAGRLPDPDQGQVRLRLRRHGGHDAAGEDVHARPHVHAGAAPRRRAALPRHGAAGLQALRRGRDRGAWRSRSSPRSRPRCSSRGPRASSRRPSRRTPSAWPSTRRCAARRTASGETILFNLTGHGHFDLGAYDAYLAGKLQDYEYPAAKVEEALAQVPKVKA